MIHLRRITSSVAYIPEIDGIRFIAISSVVVYHLAGDVLRHSPVNYGASLSSSRLFWLTQNLNFGVQMFFVLSGYVLALPFANQFLRGGSRVSLRRYFIRRLTRLEPPYIGTLVIFFCLKVLSGRGSIRQLAPHLAASVVYLHNLIYARPSDIDYVAWSLEIEVQFYILAPFISAILFWGRDKWFRRAGIAAAILLSAMMAALAPVSPRIQLSLISQLPYFLSGFMLADFHTLESEVRAKGLFWDFVGVAAFAMVYVWIYLKAPIVYLAPLTVFGAYYGVFHSRVVRKFLALPFVSIVGGMCYTIYLIHNYVISACGTYSERIGGSLPFAARLALQAAIMTPVVLGVSVLMFALIERPCMQPDWPARFSRRIRQVRTSLKLSDENAAGRA